MATHKNTNQGLNSVDTNQGLYSDEEVVYYGDLFMHLNSCYALVQQHDYSFADFLTNPDEINIHRYFANRHLFENRRSGIAILLKTFLSSPDEILVSVLDIDFLYRENAGIRANQPLPRQQQFSCWLDVTLTAHHHENQQAKFEHKHRVLWCGDKFIEPFTNYHHHERKCAGG